MVSKMASGKVVWWGIGCRAVVLKYRMPSMSGPWSGKQMATKVREEVSRIL